MRFVRTDQKRYTTPRQTVRSRRRLVCVLINNADRLIYLTGIVGVFSPKKL